MSIRIIRTAVDRGINFLDNCWDYNEGASEIRMGKALRDGYRDKVFLMTKIDGRSKKEAARQLDQSLRRLQVDMIDLGQHHEVLRYEDPHRSLTTKGPMPHSWRPGKRENSAISASRGTRIQRFICICCKWRWITVSLSIQSRCRST